VKLVISCVAEDTPGWAERVRMLSFSIRRFGGEMSQAPIVANFVGSSKSAEVLDFDSLGVTVRTVETVNAACPWANKLRMLEMPELDDNDVLLALDCDIIVLGDVRPKLKADSIGAVPELSSALVERQWQFVCERLNVPLSIVEAPEGGPTIRTYVNSGVVSIPTGMCRGLRTTWEEMIDGLMPIFDELPYIAKKRNFADQIALALAMEKEGLKFERLPYSLNYHTGGFSETFKPVIDPPFIIHYHRHLDEEGFLRRSGDPEMDREIHLFNLAWRRSTTSTTRRRRVASSG